jgi:hypothetical protein
MSDKINIFDLDYTLLDTMEFKKDLAVCLDLTDEEFSRQEIDWFKAVGKHYNPVEHLRQLQQHGLIDKKKQVVLLARLKVFFLSIDKYFFEGAEELLKKIKAQGDKLVLITLGDAEWQRLKIANSRILNQYFDDLLIEENDKLTHEFFQAIIGVKKEFVVFNDKPAEGLKMKHYIESIGGRCRAIIIKGPYSLDKEELISEAEYAQDFSELAKEALKARARPLSHEFKVH